MDCILCIVGLLELKSVLCELLVAPLRRGQWLRQGSVWILKPAIIQLSSNLVDRNGGLLAVCAIRGRLFFIFIVINLLVAARPAPPLFCPLLVV